VCPGQTGIARVRGDSEEGDSEEGDSEEGDSEEGDSEEGDLEHDGSSYGRITAHAPPPACPRYRAS
jgi:hypothetical protein